jgi:adenosine deaminase
MEAVVEGKHLAESRMSITVNIIVCGLRHLPSSTSESLAEIAWRFRDRGVCAFDLAGPESGFSSKEHKEAFAIARKKGINCTLHSGEEKAAGWESIWDSIRHCGAQRIGHGVALATNPQLMQFVADQAISLEVCITSNLQTKAIDAITAHPLRTFYDAGVRTVPCTDNRTVSGVTLTGEYMVIQDQLGFKPWEILKLMDNGFSSAFHEHGERSRIRADAFHSALRILHTHG